MFNKYDAYKDSGVKWIGEIPNHWCVEKSKWLFSLRKERALKNEEQLTASQKYGMIPQNEFMVLEGRRVTQVEFNSEILKHVEKGDFVISMRSFQGGLEYSEYTGSVSSAYVALKPTPEIFPLFFKYLFKSKRYIEALQSTSNLVRDGQALRYDNFCMVDLFLPPIEEQKKIAIFLNQRIIDIDQAIAIKEQQIALLNERKQIVIQKAVTQGLDPNVPMKDSGVEWLAQIPEKWKLMRLKFLLSEINIRSETGNETLLSLSKYKGVIPKDSLDERAGGASTLVGYKKVFKDNLVINKMQAVNGLLAVSELEGITSPDYSVYCAKDNSVNIHYIAFLLNQPEYLAEMKKRVTGVMEGFIRLYTDDLFDIKVLLPSYADQLKIVQYINTVIKQVEEATSNLVQQIEKLKEYKTTLINDAVTGKIKVA